jgi:CBS domain-containing protein
MQSPIEKINGLIPLGVCSARDTANVLGAIQYMMEYKVSGLAVVDSHGRLVANLSGTDFLVRITPYCV